MGNNISGETSRTALGALDSYVSELGADIIYEKSLGASRFLKTVKGRHKNGPVVIKIFIKPDPGLSLRSYKRRLKTEREALADIPNVYSYQTLFETEKAGYIIKQWLHSSLYDRISTRPFLSIIEKKWIAFQILTGLQEARNRKISHGDIKSENILVTSWNWVYITDFGSIKPVYLPDDDPTDYSFYFDTSGRRTCYLAPERFFSPDSEISKRKSELESENHRDGKVSEAMDVFSAGCVLAEMFLDGRDTFTLSQLFKYRSGELSMDAHLALIEDDGVRDMVSSMIALDPARRPTIAKLLQTARGSTFPESFYTFFHRFIQSVNDIEDPVTSPASPFAKLHSTSITGTSTPTEVGNLPTTSSDPPRLPSDSDTRIDRIWSEFLEIEACLSEENMEATIKGLKTFHQPSTSSMSLQDVIPVELEIPGRTSKLIGGPLGGQKAAAKDGPALIMLSLVTSNIRNCSLPSSKVRALDVLLALAGYLTDEAKLDRLVPYVIDLLHDDSVLVRGAAIRTLVQVLMLVSAITTFNTFIIPEYILPNIRHLGHDPDVSVRCIYAQCIVPLADTAMQYLEMSQALKAHGTFKVGDAHEHDEASNETSYADAVQELHALIQEQLVTLLVDPSSTVKRAILHNISELCVFFGRQKTNDVLLSHIITYLNDRDWMLRWAFFDSIVGVAACVGSRSLEEYILPLMIQALSDVEEAVVAKVLASLTSLSELSMFQKMRIWELMSAVIGFIYHPNIWIRQGAIAFLASAAKKLPSTDVWCILYPSLRSLLRSDITAITEQHLLMTVKPPLPRKIFDTAVAWAMKGDKSQYWKNIPSRAKSGAKQETGKDALTALRKSSTLSSAKYAGVRSEEDDTQITRLQALGMTQAEEIKVVALRDYILKLANSTLNFQRERQEGVQAQIINPAADYELQKLGVTPHTVFFGVKDNRTIRPDITRRPTRDSTGRRISITGTPRSSRLNSIDPSGREGLAIEDLRRRVAMMDGSTTSLTVPSSTAGSNKDVISRRESHTSLQSMLNSPATTDVSSMPANPLLPPSHEVDPSSPSESVMSGGINVLRRKYQKAAPATVGSINANVAGVLEAPKPRAMEDEVVAASGRTSPVSMAGTIRGQPHVSRKSSMQHYTTYEGQEPGINNLLEAVYQDHFRDPTTDFGPRIHQGPVRRRNTPRSSFSSRDPTSRKSEASLIAHYNSHTGPINGIAVAPDHAFFVSCSDDKTVKVWDTARLERNVTSKPRHTYTQHHARVTCVCILEAAHCFASAAEDGSLHVVRVPMSQTSSAPKYKQLQVIREHRVDHAGEYITCMMHYNTESASNMVYATTLANVVVLDLRTMRILLTMEDVRHHGSITAMCIDRKRAWLLTGTSTGVLTLWDLRFGLKLKSWKVAAASTSSSLTSTRVHQLAVHPAKGKGRWVMVAVETQQTSQHPVSNRSSSYGVTLIEVWDLEKDVVVETFNTEEIVPVITESHDSQASSSSLQNTQAAIGKEAEKSPAAAIAALVQSRRQLQEKENLIRDDPSPHLQEAEVEAEERKRLEARLKRVAVRALVAGTDFGGLGASGARLARAEAGDVYFSGMSPSESMISNSSATGSGRGGFLITGSEDKKIRFWDLGRIEKSTVVSGLEIVNEKPVFKTMKGSTEREPSSNTESVLSTGTGLDRPALRTSLIAHHQQQLLKPHQDCITAIACIDSPFRCGIVSGDRSGVIKVFRIETE
ncbi:Serine/threonine-protein kinase [Tulasnella sp. 419]|nr:Serine/threonine-protein kinase [Tulasnella sp. 419]